MHENTANLVHPILHYGLTLRGRLDAGETPDLDFEQARLRDLLLIASENARVPDAAQRQMHTSWLGEGGPGSALAVSAGESFLGARYALICWLDELLSDGTTWGQRWNEQKLEVDLCGTNDRAWNFWRQAEIAQCRTDLDALEAFYLCVMLGFRGQLRDHDDRLQSWIARTQIALGKVQELNWPEDVELQPPCGAPPLYGRRQLKRMVLTAWVAALIALPVLSFTIARHLAG